MKKPDRLEQAAERARRLAPKDDAAQLRMMLASVMSDSIQLAALLNVSRKEIEQYCRDYLREGSHFAIDSHGSVDPPSRTLSTGGESHCVHEGQIQNDLPADPSKGLGASHRTGESQLSRDRPSVPTSKISSRAAVSAMSSIFDERIHATTDIRWGDITRTDFFNLKIRNAFTATIERELAPLIERAPKDDAPLRDYIGVAELKRVRDLAVSARTKAMLSAKREASHV